MPLETAENRDYRTTDKSNSTSEDEKFIITNSPNLGEINKLDKQSDKLIPLNM